jgi:hypothetical protein
MLVISFKRSRIDVSGARHNPYKGAVQQRPSECLSDSLCDDTSAGAVFPFHGNCLEHRTDLVRERAEELAALCPQHVMFHAPAIPKLGAFANNNQ